MAPLAVHVKHAGKTHDVQLDPDLPPNVFKEAIYQVTGVPVDRMKVMVKGGVLKVGFWLVISGIWADEEHNRRIRTGRKLRQKL
jgi:hypothetical protein